MHGGVEVGVDRLVARATAENKSVVDVGIRPRRAESLVLNLRERGAPHVIPEAALEIQPAERAVGDHRAADEAARDIAAQRVLERVERIRVLAAAALQVGSNVDIAARIALENVCNRGDARELEERAVAAVVVRAVL